MTNFKRMQVRNVPVDTGLFIAEDHSNKRSKELDTDIDRELREEHYRYEVNMIEKDGRYFS
eukprot:367284-Amphidinium_carterae.1